MQVDPVKPTLKAPGTRRLKLKCDEPLLNFAFNFNLRRSTKLAIGQSDNIVFVYKLGRGCVHAPIPL